MPNRFRNRFIHSFQKHPKPFTGIAGSSVLKRIIKTLDRFGIVTVFLPFILLAICLAMLPDYTFWILVALVSAWLVISVIKLFKK